MNVLLTGGGMFNGLLPLVTEEPFLLLSREIAGRVMGWQQLTPTIN